MDNPFDTPILIIGLVSGVVAGLIPGRTYIRWLNRLYIIALGAFSSWFLEIHAVDWAYSHPFNPDDGAAFSMAAMFGWLPSIVWPILPTLLVVGAIRIFYRRIRGAKRSEA